MDIQTNDPERKLLRSFPRRLAGPEGRPITQRVVLLDPAETPFNRFSGLFADAVARTGVTAAPYQWGLRDLLGPDAIVFHWPVFMDPSRQREALSQFTRLRLARLVRGVKLVWVAHNVQHHEALGMPPLARQFIRNLDGVIYLSEASRRIIRQTYAIPDRAIEQVTVHGTYADAPEISFAPPARDEPASLLTFGLVRPYKNLDELARATMSVDPRIARLTIRGKRQDRAYAAELETMASRSDALHLRLSDDLLPESDLEREIDAAHGVVLPYRNILNSGSAIHALSRGRPVLVPALGSLPELAEQVGRKWVRLYEGTLTAEILAGFAGHLRQIPPGAVPDLGQLCWTRVERDLAGFFGRLFGQERGRVPLPRAGRYPPRR